MTDTELLKDFRKKVCDQIEIEAEGLHRYVVYTPFRFDDGDHFVTILKQDRGKWVLSDEGHTFMHLSYGEFNLDSQMRRNIIETALAQFSLENREGEFRLTVPEGKFGDALFSFSQALMKISDTAYWTREHVASTFMEDFRSIIRDGLPGVQPVFEYHDPDHDSNGTYTVDCFIPNSKPLLLFGINSDKKCLEAAVTIMKFKEWRKVRSIGIFEDQPEIASKTLAKFTDAADKNFSSLAVARENLSRYVSEQ